MGGRIFRENLPKENRFGGNSSEAISPGRIFGQIYSYNKCYITVNAAAM